MTHFFNLWEAVEERPVRRTDQVPKFLMDINETFKVFLNNCSWFVYVTSGILIACCVYYFFYDCKRRKELKRRRQEVQRANERIPQRRRPGAIYRDHEIFRNAIRTVRTYIESSKEKNPNQAKPYVLKRTRSGAIYGRFANRESNTQL